MFYPSTKQPFNMERFNNPSKEYRAAPFWAWNCVIDDDELKRQIEIMKTMGYGGFHIHSRTGMATPYLSKEFMDKVRICVEKSKQIDMLTYLYDEDRWPSGFAGGFVTKIPKFKQRFLHFTVNEITSKCENFSRAKLLAVFDISIDENGYLSEYNIIDKTQKASGEKWFAYLEIIESNNEWFGDECYVDILNPDAIKKFIEITHEAYKKEFENEFSKTIPSIFTDEPQSFTKNVFDSPFGQTEIRFPWTDKFAEIFKTTYNDDIIKKIPELFFELPESEVSVARYRYHELVTELFAQSFSDQCGIWCKENNIMLTGHVMEERNLVSQTKSVGDAMRHYRHFGMPGIDMLCNAHEYTTAKQAQSMSRQLGAEGVLCELDGVTNWDFDFRGHKLHGDWQAALGVTLRVPHLAWLSMNGEAKRDYPASINYQAAWAEKYHLIEDYFARVATLLTRGKAVCNVAVVHPIRNLWLDFGPKSQTGQKQSELNKYFTDLTNCLLKNNIDFDFLCEGNLEYQVNEAEITDKFKVGEMEYDVVVIPNLITIKASTLKLLEKFKAAGGKVIFAGNAPLYIDAIKSDLPFEFYKQCDKIDNDVKTIINALEQYRIIEITQNNQRVCDYLYQLRADGNDYWLFIAHADHPQNKDSQQGNKLLVKIKGEFNSEFFDCQNGEVYSVEHYNKDGFTYVSFEMFEHDSIMLRLTKEKLSCKNLKQQINATCRKALNSKCKYTLCEPNVLLLDMAEFKINDDKFQPKEEILRLDNKIRDKLGFRKRGEGILQPWLAKAEKPTNQVTLKFKFESRINYQNAYLALENPEITKITFNDEPINNEINGFYVDKCIKKVLLGDIKKGENTIITSIPFSPIIDIENIYLLGDFGVYGCDNDVYIDKLPETIAFANIANQGLKFYGGNIIYHLTAKSQNGLLNVEIPQYKGGLIEIFVDGKSAGEIIYSPYSLKIENLSDGDHKIDLKLYGTRVNTFGQLHKVDRNPGNWFGPWSWRTSGDDWSYNYNTWEQGILSPPIIY